MTRKLGGLNERWGVRKKACREIALTTHTSPIKGVEVQLKQLMRK